METAGIILTIWSACIYAVIRSLQSTCIGDTSWWARLVPMMPLVLGGASGPAIVPIIARHVEWLVGVGPVAAVVLGVGAGAVAASGHSTKHQTIDGMDSRIKRRTHGD